MTKKAKKKTGRKVGRPAFKVTAEVLKKVQAYAAQGLADYQIADCLGIHRFTFQARKEQFTDFLDAIELGRSKGIATITNSLFNTAKEGHFPAQKYYLNNRAADDWADVKAIEHSGIVEHVHLTEMTEAELEDDIAAATARLGDLAKPVERDSEAQTQPRKSSELH